jgi:hypothetical protein
MNKKLVVLSALVLLTSCQAYVVFDASAADGFEVMWVIEIPRDIYFIGETVTFTVVAFVSSDPDILLPDQMAKITIRNSTLFEVFSAWVTTNANGSAPVTWETGLDAATGNYTVILEDLADTKVIANFVVLYNEETYWQTRVDLLERDIQTQYDHLNYLFAVQKYQQQKLREMERKLTIFGALAFVTVMCALYVGMHEAAMTKRTTTGILSLPGKALDLLFKKNPIELEHEIVADARVPYEKRVPIYGHDWYCQYCDPDRTRPMTIGQLEEHRWVHYRLHLKKDSIMAKLRERKRESIRKAREKSADPTKPTLASVETYQKEWTEEKAKQNFQARLDLIKKQHKKKLITDAQAKAKIAQVRVELEAVNRKKQVLERSTSPKPEPQRKVRVERRLSHLPKPPTGILQVSKEIPAETPSYESALDELSEKLNHEKVN